MNAPDTVAAAISGIAVIVIVNVVIVIVVVIVVAVVGIYDFQPQLAIIMIKLLLLDEGGDRQEGIVSFRNTPWVTCTYVCMQEYVRMCMCVYESVYVG